MNEMIVGSRRVTLREQEMKFGTQITPTGVRFRLWAPHFSNVSIRIIEPAEVMPMRALPRGWFEIEVEGAGAGTRYCFVMEDGREVPDPASRFQPEDVHGPSEVVDPLQFEWHDVGWPGRPWEEVVIYELHVGTFTPEGTFLSIIDKLDYLVDLGITALELMPIADFPGRWNWGYDGVLPFAPDSSYGRPEDLKRLVEAAHARGLMVFLDVVYNHFGPEGNYLGVYSPILTDAHHTPWGAAINYDDEGASMIRNFVFANARYWLNEYRFDGLRFDAVHEIRDGGPKHMLQDLAEQVRAATDGRHVHLIVENSKNEADWLKPRWDGTPWLYNAQWNDDIHNVLHALTTGEAFWYYRDFKGRIDLLGRALAEGFGWQGEFMQHLGAPRGESSAHLPPTAFVAFIQNHDQIGNRPLGDRIADLVPPEAARALAAIILLSPQIPMLFMGEEWAAGQPFLFFSDMGPELSRKVVEGRQKELAEMLAEMHESRQPPDAGSEKSFLASKLDWDGRTADGHARSLWLYRKLLQVRRQEIVPRLFGIGGHAGRYEVIGHCAVKVEWTLADGSTLRLIANLSSEPLDGVNVWTGHHLWLEGFATGDTLQPWSVVFDLEAPGASGAS
jgi:maltooligosyltrehalose trehalohydrolase